MSVIVMGMEMPADGTKYRVVEDQAGRKFLVEDDRFFGRCFLLRPLPEKHGRLVDANGLKETLEYYIREAGWDEKTNRVLGWVKDEFIESEAVIVESEGE